MFIVSVFNKCHHLNDLWKIANKRIVNTKVIKEFIYWTYNNVLPTSMH